MSDKKKQQLGMNPSTAQHRLRKSILFDLVAKAGLNICHQCKAEIECEGDLSIEHKIPWLDSDDPAGLFFDLDNVAFSHLKCNVGAARKSKTSEEHQRERSNRNNRKCYTPEKRRERYLRTGR